MGRSATPGSVRYAAADVAPAVLQEAGGRSENVPDFAAPSAGADLATAKEDVPRSWASDARCALQAVARRRMSWRRLLGSGEGRVAGMSCIRDTGRGGREKDRTGSTQEPRQGLAGAVAVHAQCGL